MWAAAFRVLRLTLSDFVSAVPINDLTITGEPGYLRR